MAVLRWVTTADGARLAVHDHGGEGPPVLLLHGITANAAAMGAFAELLADRRRVLALDFRGRGESQGAPAGGILAHARDVAAVLRSLALGPTDLLGHSMGALVAVVVAAGEAAEHVGRLVLLDGAGDVPPRVLAAIAPSLTRLGTVFPSVEAYRAAFHSAPHLQPWNRHHDAFLAADMAVGPDGAVRSRVSPERIRAELEANVGLTMGPYLAAVRAPTLIVRAARPVPPGDVVLFGHDEAMAASRTIPGARLVEDPDCHHYTIAFAPGPVTRRAVRAFLVHGLSADREG
jgi:pimeloyl-ACP methyl ester carboxylesterase